VLVGGGLNSPGLTVCRDSPLTLVLLYVQLDSGVDRRFVEFMPLQKRAGDSPPFLCFPRGFLRNQVLFRSLATAVHVPRSEFALQLSLRVKGT